MYYDSGVTFYNKIFRQNKALQYGEMFCSALGQNEMIGIRCARIRKIFPCNIKATQKLDKEIINRLDEVKSGQCISLLMVDRTE